MVRSDGRTYASMLFPNTSTSGAHHGHSYRLCHAAPVANQTISRYFDQALNYAPMVSFDQEMGGAANFPCYNTSHGHPPGRGNWEWKGYKATLQSIQRRALQTGREVALMQEQCSELAMPYLGAMWTRQFWQIASQGAGMQGPPSVNPNAIDAINVGVFSYLYHEYGLGMAAAQSRARGSMEAIEPFQLRTQDHEHCGTRTHAGAVCERRQRLLAARRVASAWPPQTRRRIAPGPHGLRTSSLWARCHAPSRRAASTVHL